MHSSVHHLAPQQVPGEKHWDSSFSLSPVRNSHLPQWTQGLEKSHIKEVICTLGNYPRLRVTGATVQ